MRDNRRNRTAAWRLGRYARGGIVRLRRLCNAMSPGKRLQVILWGLFLMIAVNVIVTVMDFSRRDDASMPIRHIRVVPVVQQVELPENSLPYDTAE